MQNQNLQAAKYASEYKIKFDTTSLKNIKKWIYIVQKLHANARDYKENDIRRYLVTFEKENGT